jgi:hypothetical protein
MLLRFRCRAARRRGDMVALAVAMAIATAIVVSAALISMPGEATETPRHPVQSGAFGSLDTDSVFPSAETSPRTASVDRGGGGESAESAIDGNKEERERFRRSLMLRRVGPRLARGDYVGTWTARPGSLAARVAERLQQQQQQQQEHGYQTDLDEIEKHLDAVERAFNEATKDMLHIVKFARKFLWSFMWGVFFCSLLELASRRR